MSTRQRAALAILERGLWVSLACASQAVESVFEHARVAFCFLRDTTPPPSSVVTVRATTAPDHRTVN